MKKFLCFILCGVLLLSICSCEQHTDSLAWLQYQIKRDFARYINDGSGVCEKINSDDVTIEQIFDVYQDNAVALFITSNNLMYFDSMVEEDIAGIHFVFPNSQELYIYHDRKFTPLKEAYKSGIILKEDVKDIYTRYMNNPESEYNNEIKREYARYLNQKEIGNDYKTEDIAFDFYFGIYHGVTALRFSTDINYLLPAAEEDIDGIHFVFPNSQPIYIYSAEDKTFTPLKEAFEKGIVTSETVKDISSKFWVETSEEQRSEIQENYAEYLKANANENDVTAGDIYIENYLGTYDDNIIALALTYGDYSFYDFIKEDIAGFLFSYPDTHPLYIYRQGTFTRLKEAYESGIISEKDVKEIHNLFEEEY